MTIRSLLLVTAAALAACSSDAPDGTTGAMQQSSTHPDCAPNDTACQNDGLDAPLAAGARLPLDVRITARGVAAPKIRLESVRDDVLSVDRDHGALVGLAKGWSSVVFVREDDGLVMDFITMTVEKAERIELYRLTKDGGAEAAPLPDSIQLAPGDDFEIAVKPFVGATRLLGDLEASWSLDQADVATLLDTGRPASRRVRVKSAGKGTITIDAGGFTKTLSVEVLP